MWPWLGLVVATVCLLCSAVIRPSRGESLGPAPPLLILSHGHESDHHSSFDRQDPPRVSVNVLASTMLRLDKLALRPVLPGPSYHGAALRRPTFSSSQTDFPSSRTMMYMSRTNKQDAEADAGENSASRVLSVCVCVCEPHVPFAASMASLPAIGRAKEGRRKGGREKDRWHDLLIALKRCLS